MADLINIMLTIATLVDAEYPPDEHAKDIIENIQRFFSSAQVKVERVEFFISDEPDPSGRRNEEKE